jgi:hypothetical protein
MIESVCVCVCARRCRSHLFWRSLEILDTKGVDSDDLDPEVQAPFEAPVDTCVREIFIFSGTVCFN